MLLKLPNDLTNARSVYLISGVQEGGGVVEKREVVNKLNKANMLSAKILREF